MKYEHSNCMILTNFDVRGYIRMLEMFRVVFVMDF